MLPALPYQSLQDFTALPRVREIVRDHGPGLVIHSLPTAASITGLEISRKKATTRAELEASGREPDRAALAVMQHLHDLAHTVFKNISHAVELPWERYLGEMHEFNAPGTDELRVVAPEEPVLFAWSSLTILVSTEDPTKAVVLFGPALSVLTEGATPPPISKTLDAAKLDVFGRSLAGTGLLVYSVRPNDDVFYTRTAGALMTPLSSVEYSNRQRVKQIDFSHS